jgi:cysteine desulfurase/selenocysteine lyase
MPTTSSSAPTSPPFAENPNMPGLDVAAVRADFPILQQPQANHAPLIYLDNAATTQKPNAVIDRMTQFLQAEYGTVRRGVYQLSAKATEAFEAVRHQTAQFLHAARPEEIIFTRGCTEGINLVAATYGRQNVQAGDEVLISGLEHHANLVPWQQLCLEKGATLRVIPVLDDGTLDLLAFEKLLTPKTKLLALTHTSNALGTVVPAQQMIAQAHAQGVPVLLDGAQSVPHMPVDVQALDCDFFVFSGHKCYGPTGAGVLYGKMALLEAMPPYQFGGDMIEWVTFEKTTFQKPPARFEAGTPAILEVIGLGAALAYLSRLGMANVSAHEQALLGLATKKLRDIPGLRIIGEAPEKAAVISFTLDNVHPHDIGTLLDREGIAVRAGHHCAQPVMARFDVPATARASFGIYNLPEEIDALVAGLHKIRTLFS